MRSALRLGLCLLVTVGAFLSAPEARANDIANFTTVFRTDVAYAGRAAMRGNGSGTIELAGVSGTVTKAFLYWHGPTYSDDPSANAAVEFAGTSIQGTNIGFSNDNCWGFINSQAYRADVTSLVPGNGSYSLASFLKPDVADINGVSLVVFFNDGNAANNRDVVLFDGNDSNIPNTFDADGWNVTLAGIKYESGTASLDMHVSDGQPFADDRLVLNGQTLAPAGAVFQGDSVPGNPNNPYFNLWDIKPFDVTAFLNPGDNTLTLTTGVNSDCLSLVVAAVNLPAGAAPGQPPTCSTGGFFAEPTLLNSDRDEDGTISGQVHPNEPGIDPLDNLVHEVNCDAVITVEDLTGL